MIVAVPVALPVTRPVEVTEAIAELLLVHDVPPDDARDNVLVGHIAPLLPVIAAGVVLTVTG